MSPPSTMPTAVGIDDSGNEVHRRRAEEACDEGACRPLIDVGGPAHLLDPPLSMTIKMSASVIASIWSWVTNRLVTPCSAVQPLDLKPHLGAQLGVEVRQRLVEQKDFWFTDNGATHGDALALAAGELARLALQVVFKLRHLGDFGHAPFDLGRFTPATVSE